jgi:hypothetical protein
MPLTDAGHITEFYAGYNGTCGECALEVAYAACQHKPASLPDMVAITHEMQAHGGASANGASTLYSLAQEAQRRNLPILTEWDYAEPFPHDWHSVLLKDGGINPIILQLANGQALRDVETGAADEVGLHYHFIVILGKQADGYIVNDGDNWQVTSRFQAYPYITLNNAVVCGLLMLAPLASPSAMPLPSGWTDNGSTMSAPNKHTVVLGFRQFILDNPWDPTDEPQEEQRHLALTEAHNPALGAGDRQVFLRTALRYNTPNEGVKKIDLGAELLAVERGVASAQAALTQAATKVADLQTQVNLLQGQLSSAGKSLAAITALKAALT